MSDLSSECECSLYRVVFVLKEREYVLNKESPCSMQDSSINKNCHEQTELKHKFQEKRGKIFLKGQNLHKKACSPLEKKLETLCPFAGTGPLDRGTGLCLAQDSVLRDVSFRGRRLLLMKRTASCLLPGPLGSGRAGTGQKVCRRHKKSSVQPCSGPKAALRGRVLFGGSSCFFAGRPLSYLHDFRAVPMPEAAWCCPAWCCPGSAVERFAWTGPFAGPGALSVCPFPKPFTSPINEHEHVSTGKEAFDRR